MTKNAKNRKAVAQRNADLAERRQGIDDRISARELPRLSRNLACTAVSWDKVGSSKAGETHAPLPKEGGRYNPPAIPKYAQSKHNSQKVRERNRNLIRERDDRNFAETNPNGQTRQQEAVKRQVIHGISIQSRVSPRDIITPTY